MTTPRQVLCLGKVWRDEECTVPLPHSFGDHISDKDRLWVMYQMCYTVPKNCGVTYNFERLAFAVIVF